MSADLRDRTASSAAVGSRSTPVRPVTTDDPVRVLQHALYRAAKAEPGRRFHALSDKVSRRDVLWRAWAAVRRLRGPALVAALERSPLPPVRQHLRLLRSLVLFGDLELGSGAVR